MALEETSDDDVSHLEKGGVDKSLCAKTVSGGKTVEVPLGWPGKEEQCPRRGGGRWQLSSCG